MRLLLQILGGSILIVFCAGAITGFAIAYKIEWIKTRFDVTLDRWLESAKRLTNKKRMN